MSEVNFVVDQAALDLVENTKIRANFAECKEALADMIAPYTKMVVTEDGISAAKADRAKIRKVATRIDDTRKAVKKAYSAPLAAFEAECKELIAICEEGSNNLDRQVREFEDRERQEKIAAIRKTYEELADEEVRPYISWERVENPKWGNKGYAIEDAQEDVRKAIDDTRKDLEAIRAFGGENTTYLLDFYRQTHDLRAVTQKNLDLVAAKEAEQRRREQEEAARREAEIMRKSVRTETIAEEDRMEEEVGEEASEPLLTVDFRVWATREQLTELGQYMKANGIKYGRAT